MLYFLDKLFNYYLKVMNDKCQISNSNYPHPISGHKSMAIFVVFMKKKGYLAGPHPTKSGSVLFNVNDFTCSFELFSTEHLYK